MSRPRVVFVLRKIRDDYSKLIQRMEADPGEFRVSWLGELTELQGRVRNATMEAGRAVPAPVPDMPCHSPLCCGEVSP